jgi:cell division septum initiation protein DivIVA
MTDTSMMPETPDVAEIASFLRRFAGLMANGYNATYLHHAADLLETLTARLTSTLDEEKLGRYKYETLSEHADALEAECDALKHDIDGHLNITSSLLTERDTLKDALQAREAEVTRLNEAMDRQRGELATRAEAHEAALIGLQASFDARGQELEQLRLKSESERADFQARSKVSDDELAALRMVFEREGGALRAKIAALEEKRAELRTAFDRISDLRIQTVQPQGAADLLGSDGPVLAAEANPLSAQSGYGDLDIGESNAVVPKTTLRQARAQFEYLAREFVPLGDIASQVMCELGAYTMDLALVSGQPDDHLPIGEVARNILAPAGATSPVTADTM